MDCGLFLLGRARYNSAVEKAKLAPALTSQMNQKSLLKTYLWGE